ncbi:hypothetical protein ACFE04_006817 [Oxalis oulophora]
MATLQRFKHLATQCAVIADSPTRSPSASPVIHLRRRKTLRMLLNRTSADHDHHHDRRRYFKNSESSSPPVEKNGKNKKKEKKIRGRHKLKDLFVSSPPSFESDDGDETDVLGFLPATGSAGNGGFSPVNSRRGAIRPLSTATFRYRLIRRAWRPVLVAIPEQ